MTAFTIHTVDTAPEDSKAMLDDTKKQTGMIPNLFGVLAESPSTLKAYQQLHQAFLDTSFNPEELTVVWQTINVENKCTYCVPAHTGIAHSMKVDPALTEALRNKAAMPNAKLQALQDATLSIVRNRGNISEAELAAFYAAGYGQQQVLEIILGLSQKVISNYTNHVAKTPVDEVFKKFAW
ncbi:MULTISPECIES: carboxymuconolactone decarboxylase family protein [Shewanella]|uniref:Carboxymuconolactone decarboxylase family protein n=1 Tax=Shewanella psychromarinicola TaxID=2487742 RepID=A0A3N4DGD9_9GAMM|nr:carboxymuconolactone decarboxylase family protein [Shewanella psychromarinicola]AZG33558.1 carboxymuconolactone decarboxylase family protein [Shewanella psychromarinicola]MCL1082439.1 carboxymuconolactone decarboxylase family protein [Shewanella psychromarinicola]RPA23647.1 carboxymuconolactone decarboxylase family protein [Shewanella psychromarinicola]